MVKVRELRAYILGCDNDAEVVLTEEDFTGEGTFIALDAVLATLARGPDEEPASGAGHDPFDLSNLPEPARRALKDWQGLADDIAATFVMIHHDVAGGRVLAPVERPEDLQMVLNAIRSIGYGEADSFLYRHTMLDDAGRQAGYHRAVVAKYLSDENDVSHAIASTRRALEAAATPHGAAALAGVREFIGLCESYYVQGREDHEGREDPAIIDGLAELAS